MRTVTYKCDRCGKKDNNNAMGLVQVGVHVGEYNRLSSCTEPKVEYNQKWCDNCREATGLMTPLKDSTIVVKPVTLEELVRDIAYESAEKYAQNN